MSNQDFSLTLQFDQSPEEVFDAINNVRGWWSEEIEGNTTNKGDVFKYQYQDVHRCTMKLEEVLPGKKVVWRVLDNYFSFTQDKTEWINTRVVFDISTKDGKTVLVFTHEGLVPSYECYNACVNGWTQYIQRSLPALVSTGKGQPNSKEKGYTVHEVAARFHELAQQEKWFDIQDELFDNDVQSIEPGHSPWLQNASGKSSVREKAENFVKRVEEVHHARTTAPVVGSNFFAVGRELDITVNGIGRIQLNELMVYEVKHGKIISEQFFY